MWQVPAVTLTFVALLALCEWFTERTGISAVHGRKLGHAGGAICASALSLFMTLDAIAIVAALFIPFMLSHVDTTGFHSSIGPRTVR